MKTQVVKDCCAKSYLDMMRLQAEQSENWTFRFPMNKEKYIPIEEKFPKMSLIKSDIVKENAVLAGLAMGLLIQIWEKSHRAFFIPEITWCGISIKDSSREDNTHSDNEPGSGLVKVLGTLNSDWSTEKMGGGFTHGDVTYPIEPTDFIIFDASVPHRADNILINKKRFAIDYTVKGV
tara:strand:+ start:153 stop:686 length:534 start_codon:yes stop_codon:yes gene_type:complete